MLADEVPCQIVDGEIIEQQCLWQCAEISFQSLDDFQDSKRVHAQLIERSGQVNGSDSARDLRHECLEMGLDQMQQLLLIGHFVPRERVKSLERIPGANAGDRSCG